MTEDCLEKTLEAMRNESVSDAELEGARGRVLQKLTPPGETLCARFQVQLKDYLESRLSDSRRMLLEDHLGRCTHCREKLAELKGERTVVAMPIRRAPRAESIRRWASWAAAAAVLCVVLYIGWGIADTALVRGPRATVASVEGNLYLVSEGVLTSGANVGENQAIRTGPNSRAVLRLADGSLVEINERTELAVHAAWSGKSVRLHSGDVIVRAAKQDRLGGLRVETRDATASVKGTVFAVSAGLAGSRVAVIEGSVAVAQGGSESLLTPGRQTASNPALIGSINETVAWSRDADEYLSILASLYKIEQQLADLPAEPMRTQSALFDLLPPGVVIYGVIPNISGKLAYTADLIKQQSAENPAFGTWWNSEDGQALNRLLARVYAVTHLLGDEVVFGLSGNSQKEIPFVIAGIQPGKQAELAETLDVIAGDRLGEFPVKLTDSLIMLSSSEKNLAWLNANLGHGERTRFIDEIRARYTHGTGWLLGFDIETMKALNIADFAGGADHKNTGGRNNDLSADGRLKHVFLEQRSPQGVEENGLTLDFNGARTGPASFLAGSGSVGAAEYLSSDILAAGFVSTREPRQMLDEMTAMFAKTNSSFIENPAGIRFAADFASAFGTESAFGIEGISMSGPVWVFAAQINNPAVFDKTVRGFVDGFNADAARDGRAGHLIFDEAVSDRRAWRSLKFSEKPFSVTWTYDRSYIVSASDRSAALRAIAAKNGGGALVWSSEFQRRMAVSAGINPSAFVWVNTRGMFSDLAGLFNTNPAIGRLLAQREPVLAVFTATPERIHAASRARISGLVMDLMLMQRIGQAH